MYKLKEEDYEDYEEYGNEAVKGSSKQVGYGQEFSISKIILHPNFKPKTLKNDIALVLLDRPVDINKHFPVCLPQPGADFMGKTGLAIGRLIMVISRILLDFFI